MSFSAARPGRNGARLSAIGLVSMLSGCSDSLALNILGSYFPSWMVCAIAGVVFSIIAQRVLAVVGVDGLLPVRAVVYLSIALAFAFAMWLVWLS